MFLATEASDTSMAQQRNQGIDRRGLQMSAREMNIKHRRQSAVSTRSVPAFLGTKQFLIPMIGVHT